MIYTSMTLKNYIGLMIYGDGNMANSGLRKITKVLKNIDYIFFKKGI